jgi:putative aldouronate transport system substrate-binding protein
MRNAKTINRRSFLRLSGMVAAGGLFAGCQPTAPAAAPTQPAAAGGTAAPAAPDRVVLWSPGDNGTVADWATDPILAVVQEKTNTQIEMLKIGWDTYQEQLNAAVASDNLPDIIGVIDHNAKTQIQQWADDGVIAPYEGAVAEAAPNVIAQYQQNPTLNEIKVNDKIYAQPISWGDGNYPNMGLVHVRKDLLDKYGMTPPDTFEQYFEYLRAAKADGMQGVVFSAGNGVGPALNSFAGAHGAPMLGWVKKNGAYEFWALQPEIKESLLMFRAMVAEGLVDPASWEDREGNARDMYVSGQAASLIFNGGGHIGRIQNDMDLAGSGAQEYILPALDAGKGARGYTSEPMFWGVSFLGGMRNNNPAAAARVINYLISEEGYKLTTVGVEGIDHKVEDGEIVMLPERAQRGFPTEAGDTGAHPLASTIVSWQPQEWQDWALLYGKDQAFKDWYHNMYANQGKHQVESFGQLSTSPLWTAFQSTSAELITRSFLDIVRASSDEEAARLYDQFVQDWKGAGGEQAQAEMSSLLVSVYG